MSRDLFRPGGELQTTRVGSDQYQMTVTLPKDNDGRVGRECHAPDCSPAYFKVKPGTGIAGRQEVAYCPYCRHQDEPGKFFSSEQLRYAKDLAVSEALTGLGAMFKDALGLDSCGRRKIGGGLLSIEMSLKEAPKPHIRRPLEEEVRRDVVCPNCCLDQSVYGLATWCADCGNDIFLSHVEAEFAVVHAMLADVERRRTDLGTRIAAKDIENCLEDVVSIFEAVLRVLVRRRLGATARPAEEVERFFRRLGSAFQNVNRSAEIFRQDFDLEIMGCMTEQQAAEFGRTVEKRHPITHNLGVIDRKYLERAKSAESEGKEVLVTVEEVEEAIAASMKIFAWVHSNLPPEPV